MHARVSISEGSPAPMDQLLSEVREDFLPRGSEVAMRASEDAANQLRAESAEAGSDKIAGVESYEVGLFEVENYKRV
jgi:hypothetical protein